MFNALSPRPLMRFLAVCAMVLCAVILLIGLLRPPVGWHTLLIVALLMAALMGVLLLRSWLFWPRVLITPAGLTYERPRRGRGCQLPWQGFTDLYHVTGRRTRYLLLSPRPLDAAAQAAAARACLAAKDTPFLCDGCLLLPPLNEKELLARLPQHIRRAPDWQVASM